MRAKRLVGLSVFIVLCCLFIITAGGGWAFLRHLVGAVYMLFWVIWWLLVAVGRQRGAPSAYDLSQRMIRALGIVALEGYRQKVRWRLVPYIF